MGLLIDLINLAFKIAYFIVVAQVAIHWLAIFGVINLNNDQARQLVDKLNEITEPVYSKIRQFIPAIGGIDLTPLIAMIGLSLLKNIILSILL